jgi:hypothetical protein
VVVVDSVEAAAGGVEFQEYELYENIPPLQQTSVDGAVQLAGFHGHAPGS